MRRRATPQDFEDVYQIFMDESVNPFLNVAPMDRRSFRPLFEELLEEGTLHVCEVEGAVAGLYTLRRRVRRLSHVAHISSFALKGAYQGQGLGTRIMEEIIAELRAEGFRRLDMTVESDNLTAIHFYHKLGFKIEGLLHRYFKREYEDQYTDNYTMALLL
jgi:putative acetyltransferase